MNYASLHRTTSSEALNVHSIRQQFPLLKEEMNGQPIVFLDSAASSQKPLVVIDAISDYYKSQHANVHRGVYALSAAATDAFERTRDTARQFVNASSTREIIFTKGTTEGINLVATGFEREILKEGDEVLITYMEHHSNIVPWQIACARTGAHIKAVPVRPNGELDMDAFSGALNDRTRIVAVVYISNTLGTINPVRQIIEQSHGRGIPVLLDGAQAAPHLPIDVQDLDVDFLAFSSHKMYGPTGMGVLYGKEEWLDRLPPYQGGGEMIREVRIERTEYNDLPFKFEAGTPHIAGAIGMEAAMHFMRSLPWVDVMKHEASLLSRASEMLMSVEGLRIIGQAGEKAGALSFVVDGLHPQDIGTLLDQQGVAVRTGHHCTEPLMRHFGLTGTVRASFAMYNTMDDAEKLVHAVEKAVQMLR